MFPVGDLMSSTVNAKVNSEFLTWLYAVCGEHGKAKATRGNFHDYLGMTIVFSFKGKVTASMQECKLVDEFPCKISGTDETPAAKTC
jgi:hypothetical protein